MRTRRRRAIIFAVVIAGHAVVLVLMTPRVRPPSALAAAPAMQVSLVAPRRPARPPAAHPPPTPRSGRARTAHRTQPRPTAPPAPAAPAVGEADLFAAPYADARPRLHAYRPPCDFTGDIRTLPDGSPCPAQSREPPLSARAEESPASGTFAAEARRKEVLRTYRDRYDAKSYPGIACTILHRC